WGYRYDAWSLRRFALCKRQAIVLCFLQAVLAETTDAIIEMQDKLITRVHNKARQRRDDLLRATEKARTHAIEVLEELATLVLDESIPDAELRAHIFARLPSATMSELVEGCRALRAGNDGAHLSFLTHWYGYTRKYSPALLETTPFQFAAASPLGQAVTHLRELNRDPNRKLTSATPTDFLSPRWTKYVVSQDAAGNAVLSRPYY